MKRIVRLLLLIVLSPSVLFAAELPDDSIYHIGSQWRDQNNIDHNISDFSGKVQVLAFIYTYCEHSCPIIIANLKSVKAKLSAAQNSDAQFLLVSLDPERDTPEVLNNYMHEHDMKTGEWNMLNGDPGDVRELSALIGVRYQPMDMEGKDIAHSNMITVLDKSGRIHYQMKGLEESLGDVVEAIATAVIN